MCNEASLCSIMFHYVSDLIKSHTTSRDLPNSFVLFQYRKFAPKSHRLFESATTSASRANFRGEAAPVWDVLASSWVGLWRQSRIEHSRSDEVDCLGTRPTTRRTMTTWEEGDTREEAKDGEQGDDSEKVDWSSQGWCRGGAVASSRRAPAARVCKKGNNGGGLWLISWAKRHPTWKWHSRRNYTNSVILALRWWAWAQLRA